MRIAVAYQDETLDFEVAEDRLIGHWSGPTDTPDADLGKLFREAFESPDDFPPLRSAVVPGDRVVVPLDGSMPGLRLCLEILVDLLRAAEVESITIVSTTRAPTDLPEGVTWCLHDPDDKSQIAYLASTTDGRRVYLNKALTDADLVLPIGWLGYDGTLGYRGPWSVIYPGLSDAETLARYRGLTAEKTPEIDKPSTSVVESTEVTWLLGCQFQVGVVGGATGVAQVVAGLESSVRARGAEEVDHAWSFSVEERADVVVAGIGAAGLPTTLDALAEGLASAARLVRRGGKIVALSRAQGAFGPSLRRIVGSENPRSALSRLRGRESDTDYLVARRLVEALDWADVYLHSGLDPDLVEDLGLIPLDRPEEARKLAANAHSCLFLSQADRTRATVTDD